MATAKKQPEGQDFEENFQILNNLVKENVLSSFETFATLIEESQKLATAQFDQFYSLENDYAERLRNSLDRFIKDLSAYSYPNTNLDSFVDAQKSYVKLLKDASNRVLQNSFSLWRKSAENAFSALEGFYRTWDSKF